MSKKLILVILAVGILGIGGVVVATRGHNKSQGSASTNQQTTSTNTEATAPKTSSTASSTTKPNTVVYTDSGFSPATLSVKLGTKVTFKNESSLLMWVASNPHPTHTDYPGFDERASSATGESYSFTFDQKGSWGYHNHMNPSDGGTVVVR